MGRALMLLVTWILPKPHRRDESCLVCHCRCNRRYIIAFWGRVIENIPPRRTAKSCKVLEGYGPGPLFHIVERQGKVKACHWWACLTTPSEEPGGGVHCIPEATAVSIPSKMLPAAPMLTFEGRDADCGQFTALAVRVIRKPGNHDDSTPFAVAWLWLYLEG